MLAGQEGEQRPGGASRVQNVPHRDSWPSRSELSLAGWRKAGSRAEAGLFSSSLRQAQPRVAPSGRELPVPAAGPHARRGEAGCSLFRVQKAGRARPQARRGSDGTVVWLEGPSPAIQWSDMDPRSLAPTGGIVLKLHRRARAGSSVNGKRPCSGAGPRAGARGGEGGLLTNSRGM